MADLILYAIPAFVLLLAVEPWSFRIAADEDLVGYESRDTRTSLAMGAGNVAINAVWKLVVVVVYAGLYELTPLRMPADQWWTYVVLFFADDFAYYWFHRIHHEVRIFWASHVVHHSSQHYNLSTAQTWTPRLQRALPRPQLRRHPDHLGPPVRDLPRGDRAGSVRVDAEPAHLQADPGRLPRVRGDRARRALGCQLAPSPRLPLPRPRMVAGRPRRRDAGLGSPG